MGDSRRELAQLVADHVFGDGNLVVGLAVVHKELEPDEAGQDGGGARLRPDRLARAGDVEPVPLATARDGGGGGCGRRTGRYWALRRCVSAWR